MVPKTMQNTNSKYTEMPIENFWVSISVTRLFCHCNYFLSSKMTSKFDLFWLILSLSCSLWIYRIAGMHILTSFLNFDIHLCDTAPPILGSLLIILSISQQCDINKALGDTIKISYISVSFHYRKHLRYAFLHCIPLTFAILFKIPSTIF